MRARATRSKKALEKGKNVSQSQSSEPNNAANAEKTLGPKDENPPHILILPKGSSPTARIVTIQGHDQRGHRYFVDPAKGVYELTAISHPRQACRTWLLAPHRENLPDDDKHGGSVSKDDEGYVMSSSTMLVATPIDPLFVLLNVPGVLFSNSDTAGRSEFESFENRMWSMKSTAAHLGKVLQDNPDSALQKAFKSRIQAVCDEQDLGCDELQYCLVNEKLARFLLSRAEKMASHGLPASMEERFVRQALAMPEVSVRREDSGVSMVSSGGAEDDLEGSKQRDTSTSPTTQRGNGTKREQAAHLLRIRIALDYMLVNYIPPGLRSRLRGIFKEQCDFSILDQHLNDIARLKAEALALRSISDNISRKRGALDDDEAFEKQEAKKRKKAEEEQKKKNASQAVKKLLKADTSGMKKLSSFFTKTAAKQ